MLNVWLKVFEVESAAFPWGLEEEGRLRLPLPKHGEKQSYHQRNVVGWGDSEREADLS